jgi:hypothetical protein
MSRTQTFGTGRKLQVPLGAITRWIIFLIVIVALALGAFDVGRHGFGPRSSDPSKLPTSGQAR